MADYERPLGEDGPGEGGEVRDRGLFRHRREADEYGGGYGAEYARPPPGEVPYVEGGGDGYGGGYGGYGGGGYAGEGYGGRYGGYGGGGYAGEGYGGRPEVGYGQPVGQASDLGTGLMDSGVRTEPDYGSSLTTPDMAGVPVGAYERRDEDDYDEQRRHKHYAEAAAAAALGYGLHERHERKEEEEKLQDLRYDL